MIVIRKIKQNIQYNYVIHISFIIVISYNIIVVETKSIGEFPSETPCRVACGHLSAACVHVNNKS